MAQSDRIDSLEVVTRIFALAGLAVATMLTRDYLGATPVFCGAGGGCDVVHQSRWAHLASVPTPVFGLAYFGAMIVLLCIPSERVRRIVPLVAIPGALAGLGFVALQLFVIHAICRFCFIADVAAIGLLPLALIARAAPSSGDRSWTVFALGAALAVGVPLLLSGPAVRAAKYSGGAYQPTLLPPIAAAEAPGTPTIVEFIDFECPYCRKEASSLRKLLAKHPEVKIVRKMTPLPPDMHPHATDAARAWCCADEAGKGDAMGDLLMTTDPDTMSTAKLAKLAAKVGVDPAAYQECIASQRPEARMTSDAKDFTAANLIGLPTFWIGHTKFVGAQDDAVVAAAIDRAIADAHP